MTSPPDDNKTLDERLVEAIKSFESYKPTVYKDGKSHVDPKTGKTIEELSVGFGHHLHKGDGLKVGDVVSVAQANTLLDADIAKYKNFIQQWAQTNSVTLSPNEQDALVDLTFNEGPKTLVPAAGGDKPALAAALEKRAADSRHGANPARTKADNDAVLAAIQAWDKMHKGDDIVESPYLKKRRTLDTAMFVGDMQEVEGVTEAISKWNGTSHGIHVAKTHKKPSHEQS